MHVAVPSTTVLTCSRPSSPAFFRPPGVSIAAARLAYFARAARLSSHKQHLELVTLLTAPQQQLLQANPKLDPQLAAARAAGIADADAEVLRLRYPGLGPQALSAGVLEGLRPEYK